MAYLTNDDARRLAKRLKRILAEEFGGDPRLNWCQKAVAEALDFAHTHDMVTSLPGEVEWHGEWCANHLADNGYVASEEDGRIAVDRLEEELSRVLAGGTREMVPVPPHPGLASFSV